MNLTDIGTSGGPVIYQSLRLTDLTLKWINMARLKVKDYIEKTDKFKTQLKRFTAALTKEKNFEFNRQSIYQVLNKHYNLK